MNNEGRPVTTTSLISQLNRLSTGGQFNLGDTLVTRLDDRFQVCPHAMSGDTLTGQTIWRLDESPELATHLVLIHSHLIIV